MCPFWSQGSILGPLLFTITTDRLASVTMSIGAKLVLYADDICYYRTLISDSDCVEIQSDVDTILNWVINRNLRSTVLKCKAMVIFRKHHPPLLHIIINHSPIHKVDSFNYLDVTISNKLTWSNHNYRFNLCQG